MELNGNSLKEKRKTTGSRMEKMSSSRRNLVSFVVGFLFGYFDFWKWQVDLTLSASGRASFKQLNRSQKHPFVSSASDTTMEMEDCTICNSMAWTWGSGKYGRLGHGSTMDASVPAPVETFSDSSVHDIACGSFVTAFIVEHGQVWMSGKDINNLFAGTEHESKLKEDYLTPIEIPFFHTVCIQQVAVGETICAAISEFGELFWWGSDFGKGVQSSKTLPKMTVVSCGSSHALALATDGSVYSWGRNEARQTGHAVLEEPMLNPTKLKGPEKCGKFKSISCDSTSSALLSVEGNIYALGTVVGQRDVQIIADLQHLKTKGIRKLYCNDLYICCVNMLGDVFIWTLNKVPFLPKTDFSSVHRVFEDLSVRDVVCGIDFLSALTDCGSIYSWGRSSTMLGVGEVRAKKHIIGPKLVGSFSARRVRKATSGSAHCAAVLTPVNGERESIGWEMLESERVYFRSLTILLDVFRSQNKKPRSVLSKMFAEVESMATIHGSLLQELETKMESWTDASTLGTMLKNISSKKVIENYTRFHRLHTEWSKKSGNYQVGGKKFAQTEEALTMVSEIRKTETAYERKKPVNLIGLLNEPFERIRGYFWFSSRLRSFTPEWHPDSKDLLAAAECFERELSGYFSELEMMKLSIARLEDDKTELLQKISLLSITNDNLFLSRNNHEMQKRELTEISEQYQHKVRTMQKENEQIRERVLQLFLEKRKETIRKRRAQNRQQQAQQEAELFKGEAKRLEAELKMTRSSKMFREIASLQSSNLDKDKEIFRLKQLLEQQKNKEVLQGYEADHVARLEKESSRLRSEIAESKVALVDAIRKRHCPLGEEDLKAYCAAKEPVNHSPMYNSDGEVRGSTVKGFYPCCVVCCLFVISVLRLGSAANSDGRERIREELYAVILLDLQAVLDTNGALFLAARAVLQSAKGSRSAYTMESSAWGNSLLDHRVSQRFCGRCSSQSFALGILRRNCGGHIIPCHCRCYHEGFPSPKSEPHDSLQRASTTNGKSEAKQSSSSGSKLPRKECPRRDTSATAGID